MIQGDLGNVVFLFLIHQLIIFSLLTLTMSALHFIGLSRILIYYML